MEMQLREEHMVQILSCQGRIDAQVSDRVKERVQELLDQGASQIILDLEGVELLDSSGLGALVSCMRKAKEKEGEIKLAGLRLEVRSIFDITRVSRLFHICEHVEEALEAFQTTFSPKT